MTPIARIAAWLNRTRYSRKCAYCGKQVLIAEAIPYGYYSACSEEHRAELTAAAAW